MSTSIDNEKPYVRCNRRTEQPSLISTTIEDKREQKVYILELMKIKYYVYLKYKIP